MKITTCLALFILSTTAFAKIQESYFVKSQDKSLIKLIATHPELTIDHAHHDGFELYGPKGTSKWLDMYGVDYSAMIELNNKALYADYPSYTQMTQTLKGIANKCSNIIKMFSIGKSVQGKELWFLKISDNPEVDEVEPEVKYISSMHGDEITGRELMVRFIDDLCNQYQKNGEITELINNTEIYIMPSMNPDGSELHQRANANDEDLNRNFPDWTVTRDNSTASREVETQLMMKFQATRQFSLSANFHGGSVVVNYPWDASYDPHPFDNLVAAISTDYANLNPEMKNSTEFQGGITNGANWYVVRGGMQDWSYVWHNDLQVTVELSYTKWPSYSEIPKFYKNNKDSLLVYLQKSYQGAGFKLNNSQANGTVEVVDLSGKKQSLGKYAFVRGEFYKILPVGEYEFRLDNGKTFTTQVKEHLSQDNGNFTYLD